MAQTIQIDLNPGLFNDIYWELQKDLDNPDLRYIWLYGGSSASKTYSYCQADIVRKLTRKDDNTMIIRKYGVDIKDSIYSDFVGIIQDWGLQDYFVCQINYIECLLTGSYIRFRGLDDSEKIKGMARFKRVVYEEISQGDHQDLKQIRKRLRGKEGQQIIGIFNPISEEHWIKKEVFDKQSLINVPTDKNITSVQVSDTGNTKIYRLTYLNNYYIVGKWKDGKQIGGFVDKHTIDDFEHDKANDYNAYEVYALGLWGNVRSGGEFYKNFKRDIHVGTTEYDPSKPLHISWDDNVHPYLPCGIFQIDGNHVMMLDEIAGENPNNTVKAVCELFAKKYPDHSSGIFVYGDSTARKADTKIEKGHNFYTIITSCLSKYRPALRVLKANPSVTMRGNWINAIFAGDRGDIRVTIGVNCTKTINDISGVKEAPDGTKYKEMTKDESTGVRYQKYGHFSDLFDYLLCAAFENDYTDFGGKGKIQVRSSGVSSVRDRYFK